MTLNRYYYDVLMYEFSLNNRSSSYMETVFQVRVNIFQCLYLKA